MCKIKFFYFDMGNVLLNLDRPRAIRSVATLANVSPEVVGKLITDNDLELQYEAGKISSQQFYDSFCEATNTKPDYRKFGIAVSDLFDINLSMMMVVGKLLTVSLPVGLLSNTNDFHWQHVAGGRFSFFPNSFRTTILSHEVGANKPDQKIYQAAIEKSGFAADEILYVDDKLENVEAAKQQGIDAVLYTTTADYIHELQQRDVQFNY